MSTLAKKFSVGTAACVIAAAAALTPATVAHADPAMPRTTIDQADSAPMSGGFSVIPQLCDPASSNCAASGSNAQSSLSVGGDSTIWQNPLWWFGTPNPNPPPQFAVLTFYPLALLPGFTRPFFSWFENLNFEVCIGGLGVRVGPYGAVSGSIGRGCA